MGLTNCITHETSREWEPRIVATVLRERFAPSHTLLPAQEDASVYQRTFMTSVVH
jgi:hypothetical protein